MKTLHFAKLDRYTHTGTSLFKLTSEIGPGLGRLASKWRSPKKVWYLSYWSICFNSLNDIGLGVYSVPVDHRYKLNRSFDSWVDLEFRIK